MKTWILWLSLAGLAMAAPSETRLRLTEGVRGGYAPSPPTLEVLVVPSPQGKGFDVYYKQLKSSKYLAYRKSLADLASLEDDLARLGLFQLPQAPNDMDDIYRSETALEVRTSQHRWSHQPPLGCVLGRSKVQPTAAQLQTFRSAAERIKQLAQGGQACGVEEMTKAEIDSRK